MNRSDYILELVEMATKATPKSLATGTNRMDGGVRQGNSAFVQLLDIKISPAFGTKMLTISSRSKTGWIQSIQLFGVNVAQTKEELTGKIITLSDPATKKTYYMNPIRQGESGIRVSCNCPSLRFDFSYELLQQGALGRKFIPYTRKTPPPPLGRPYRNPNHIPGACKHILRLFTLMSNTGMFI